MDSFESLMAHLLEREGYWVKTCFKVDLTKNEKKEIGRPTTARWELDLVAYKGNGNILRVIECKSFFDSRGVSIKGFSGPSEKENGKYKLFNDQVLRKVTIERLKIQLVESGACPEEPTVKLGLAVGKFASNSDRDKVRKHFDDNDWLLYDDKWLIERLENLSRTSYDNIVASVVAKILFRNCHITPKP